MPVKIILKENQANGNFNDGEIIEKNLLDFLKMVEPKSHTQIYFTGHMLLPLIEKAL